MESLAAFADDPLGSGVFLDVDGTLAPIERRPDLVAVPPRGRTLLERLAGTYAVVACVSGRRAADVRGLIGDVPVTVVGSHGMETDDAFVPEAAAWMPAIARAAAILTPVAEAAGAWVEDKVVALNVHYREAPEPEAAAAALDAAAAPLAADGLVIRRARMSLEVLPPVRIDKGTAVERLIRTHGLRRSLYAGDDATDLAALRVVDLPIAVRSAEAPPGLIEAAAIVVDSPAALLDLLDLL